MITVEYHNGHLKLMRACDTYLSLTYYYACHSVTLAGLNIPHYYDIYSVPSICNLAELQLDHIITNTSSLNINPEFLKSHLLMPGR